MRDINAAQREIAFLLESGNAHMSFEEVVADFPMALINQKAEHVPYSPWHFLDHMRIAQWDILEFIRNPNHTSPEYPGGYRPGPDEIADENRWSTTIEQFKSNRDELIAIARDPGVNLFEPIPHAKEYTIFRELLVVADHNAYHLGEFALLRQALQAWSPERPYLTGTPE